MPAWSCAGDPRNVSPIFWDAQLSTSTKSRIEVVIPPKFCHFFHVFPRPGLGAAELLAGANPAPPCRWLTALEEEGIGGKDSPGMMGF